MDEYQEPILASFLMGYGAGMRRMSIKGQPWQENDTRVYGAGYQEPTLASLLYESTEKR